MEFIKVEKESETSSIIEITDILKECFRKKWVLRVLEDNEIEKLAQVLKYFNKETR